MNIATRAVITVTALAGTVFVPAIGSAATRPAPEINPVVEWNEIANNALVAVAAQPPHVASLHLAMVQGAVFDAVNAIDGGYAPYLEGLTADPTASPEAAVAAAAFGVLVTVLPDQAAELELEYDAALGAIDDGNAKDAGVALGDAAAAAMLAARADDGRGGDPMLHAGTAAGEWRPTPPTDAEEGASWVGNVTPFVVADVSELRLRPPLDLASPEYAADLNEVAAVGSLTSSTRTADQTEAAIFWQAHGVAMHNALFRQLATSEGLDVADSARLLAMTNMALADAAIGCWENKYHWNFWRPITAIRSAADDGNPDTEPDPEWLPLFDPSTQVENGIELITPGFPEYPSGHGCVTSAAMYTLREFFGTDEMHASYTSPLTRTTREFPTFSAVLDEVIDARVWAGIHFRDADVQGAALGAEVGAAAVERFQPAG
jgi:hypothetical protein